MPSTELTTEARQQLLDVAERAIRDGLRYGPAPDPRDLDYPEALQQPRASFVTLLRNGELRGCIGSLDPYRPLVIDVAENAYAAAFRDPRFAPLTETELEGLTIEISLLSLPEPLSVRDEAELLARLRPGTDGLILREGMRRGTFLPTVWASLPEPRIFLAHLKMKAGLPPDYWSETLAVERYRTESFGRPI